MNSNNFWIHLGIAVVIITLAAVLGQIRQWEGNPADDRFMKINTPPPAREERSSSVTPEVLVRFKAGG